MQPGKELAQIDDRAQCYAFLGKTDAKPSDTVITGTISFCDRMASVLFDLGSTYSYISVKFAIGLTLVCDILDHPVYVSTPVGESVVVTYVFHACSVLFVSYQIWADLIILDMLDFDVILGMTWLFPYHTILNCNAKTETLAMPGMDGLE